MCRRINRLFLAFLLILSTSFSCTTAMADAGTPIITKNPTSEALAIGGKTWFIAHADNATSMSWELVDPNGNVYTLANAMAMNPGLNLQALEGDTIAVSNVPQSVNGWGVQATFYNQYGSISTSPAYIYVGDFLSAYSSIIDKYRIAKAANIRGAGDASQYDVSEWIAYYDHVGYALKDLDKNGIPELLISGTEAQYDNNQVLFEVYTLKNNTPLQILISWARMRFYLMTDNRIYWEASGGAAYSYYEFFKLDGDHLEFLEGYATANDNDSMNGTPGYTLYHTTTWNGNTELFMTFGDYNHPDATWPIDISDTDNNTYRKLADAFHSQCWMPQLTTIS